MRVSPAFANAAKKADRAPKYGAGVRCGQCISMGRAAKCVQRTTEQDTSSRKGELNCRRERGGEGTAYCCGQSGSEKDGGGVVMMVMTVVVE